MKFSLNDNKKLYDLCRRYKYFYKKYDEIKHLEKCYWSKYIKDAYQEAVTDLDDCTLEIIELVLGEFCSNYNTSIECTNDIERDPCWTNPDICGYCSRGKEHKVIIDDKKLMMIVEQMMRKYMDEM